jgi:hypothetical protein
MPPAFGHWNYMIEFQSILTAAQSALSFVSSPNVHADAFGYWLSKRVKLPTGIAAKPSPKRLQLLPFTVKCV